MSNQPRLCKLADVFKISAGNKFDMNKMTLAHSPLLYGAESLRTHPED